MKKDKGAMIIYLDKTEDGLTAITINGKRRGLPVNDKKLATLIKDYQEVWVVKWGYSSTEIIHRGQ